MEDRPPPEGLEELRRLFRGLRKPFDVAVFLVAIPVAVAIELVSAILAVIGIVALIVHLRADAEHVRGNPHAGWRSWVALRIGLLVMWVLDRSPFRDDTRRRSRTARPDRPRI